MNIDVFKSVEILPHNTFSDEEQEAEALQMLSAVLDIREQSPKPDKNTVAKICQTLGMLYYILDDIPRVSLKALEFHVNKLMGDFPI